MNRSALLLVAACSLISCDGPPETAEAPYPFDACFAREQGCVCEERDPVPCYLPARYEGEDLVCQSGERRCDAGRWGACENVRESRTSIAGALIAPATSCNPCNPACFEARSESIESRELTPENSRNLRYDPTTGAVITVNGEERTLTSRTGVGSDDPFDLDANPADSVELDREGALTLGTREAARDSIWIANTGEGTVSRFDVRTLAEIGRFWVGPYGRGNDPSRTSINTAGEAFVAGRNGNFVTKISPIGEFCPDTNGDGRITTSTDGRALPWGQDDCVLWTHDMRGVMPRGKVRAVAAQDVVDAATGDVRPYVWVGGYNDRRISLLDGRTGAVVMTTDVQYTPYGFALDGSGGLWMASIHNRRLVRIDTNRCNADGCPWGGVCTEPSSTSRDCEGAIKRAIPTPDSNRPYGVTVDSSQRIWVGGDRDVQRYEPDRARWATAGIGSSGGWKAGIAVDGSGNVWTTGSFGVWRLNAENPRERHLISRTASSAYARGWGVAVAADERVWIIGRWENAAWVIEPGRALDSNRITRTASTVRSPYTYSDMTGQQLRLAATPRGTYIMRFEGCASGTRWDSLQFDVETPARTSVGFRVRTADTAAGLAGATWHGVGSIRDGASGPLPVGRVFDAAGEEHGQFAEVEVALATEVLEAFEVPTPRVRWVELTRQCALPSEGYYQRTYDSTQTCNVPPDRPTWERIEYTVGTPGTSRVELLIRVADSLPDLERATDIVYPIPAGPDSGVLDLQRILQSAGEPAGRLMMRVRARLIPGGGVSAEFYALSNRWECRPSE